MPRIQRIQAPDHYKEVHSKMAQLGHERFCGPLAICMLTGAEAEEVLLLCAKHGRQPKRGMTDFKVQKVLHELGYEMKAIDQIHFIRNYPKGHRDAATCVTTHHPRRFPAAFKGANLLLRTKDHFTAVVNGVSMCWAINSSLRVTRIFCITKREESPPALPAKFIVSDPFNLMPKP